MKSRQSAMAMWRAAFNKTNVKVHDKLDHGWYWADPNFRMRQSATKLLRRAKT